MSRDWPPRMILESTKIYPELAKLTDTLMLVEKNGDTTPMYSDEEKEIAHKYYNLGICGFDVLMDCKRLGVFKSEKGQQLMQQIEDIIANNTSEDRELEEITKKWFNGQLEPGYYMDDNNEAFVQYIKNKLDKEIDI